MGKSQREEVDKWLLGTGVRLGDRGYCCLVTGFLVGG